MDFVLFLCNKERRMIMYIILSIGIIIVLLFAYSCLKVSSECSRQEEREEYIWRQQEYGKLKKD